VLVWSVMFAAAPAWALDKHSKEFDLSGLPPYKWTPSEEDKLTKHCHGAVCEGVWGVIRIHGTELTQHLVHLWQDSFLKLHPNIRFGDYFVPPGLSLKQLDGIFGAERSGGWKGSTWSTDAARSAKDNIRTWGALGLAGEWADKPINIYGIDATLSNWSDLIQRVVFKGGDKWNPA